MITWMQKHKKWLVITIWISTIAFVGAGFVGWGSYDYGKSNSAVAIVGETEVPLNDLQTEYSALYSQYSQMFGESFNKELADQLKLEDAALQRVIQKYLLINYANELGLEVTDKEVAKQLVQIEAFFKDGKFDKNTYLSVLKQNRRTATEFEEQLKKDLLVTKVQKIFNTPLLENEIKNFGELLYLEDKVSINIVDDKNIKVSTDDKALKEYWEKNKENYKTAEGFKVEYSKIDNIENKTKKEMKKIALKEYLNLKKEKSTFKTKETIYASSHFLNQDDFNELTKSKADDILKPFYTNGSYYVFKLISKIEPQIKSYSDVSNQVRADYIAQKKVEILEANAQKVIDNFKGIDIGYISRDSKKTFGKLSSQESAQLVSEIFNSTTKISSVKFEDKIVVFKIEDSKLATYDGKYENSVKAIVENIKNNEITQNLIAKLQNSYEVKSFLGNK